MIKNYVAKIKEFRGIATKHDEAGCSHYACWDPTGTLIASTQSPTKIGAILDDTVKTIFFCKVGELK